MLLYSDSSFRIDWLQQLSKLLYCKFFLILCSVPRWIDTKSLTLQYRTWILLCLVKTHTASSCSSNYGARTSSVKLFGLVREDYVEDLTDENIIISTSLSNSMALELFSLNYSFIVINTSCRSKWDFPKGFLQLCTVCCQPSTNRARFSSFSSSFSSHIPNLSPSAPALSTFFIKLKIMYFSFWHDIQKQPDLRHFC